MKLDLEKLRPELSVDSMNVSGAVLGVERYVKHSKTLGYLVKIVQELNGTVNKEATHKVLNSMEVLPYGGGWKLTAYAIVRAGKPGIRYLEGQDPRFVPTLEEKDWTILGRPV